MNDKLKQLIILKNYSNVLQSCVLCFTFSNRYFKKMQPLILFLEILVITTINYYCNYLLFYLTEFSTNITNPTLPLFLEYLTQHLPIHFLFLLRGRTTSAVRHPTQRHNPKWVMEDKRRSLCQCDDVPGARWPLHYSGGSWWPASARGVPSSRPLHKNHNEVKLANFWKSRTTELSPWPRS